MAQNLELTWGKCVVGYKVGGAAQTDEPKLDSTKLNVAEGSIQEAKIEGGETIALRRDSDSYTLEWDTYIHPANADKYKARIAEPNANITDLTVTPSNKEALSIKAPASSLHSTFSFDTQGGILMHNKATFVKSGSTPLFELAKAGTSA
nr:MAG TPA: hypothetical protein [Caudoviricetes sp.]